MELPEFKDAIAEAATLLKGVQKILPARVDAKLIEYLDRLQDDPVGLEILRAGLAAKE
jgi:hypothetical protein